jgi:cation diffusion facilitator CzcD-associated flavoprotein CzcO
MPSTDLLIIGAGPFGLSMAAHARHLGIEHIIVGKPMHFWRAHMPDGMYLRSDTSWHLDPEAIDTIEAFLHARGVTRAQATPLSRELYLEYAHWFQDRKHIEPVQRSIERLDAGGGDRRFRATLDDGRAIEADNVLLALGFAYFKHVPDDLAMLLPAGCFEHTCDFVDFADVRGRRFLIVGGRQSAFEWAALMAEAGAATVHVAHRHDSPAFVTSDWEWVDPLVNRLFENPGWYTRLSKADQEGISHRLWSEGRLKLEPWLAPRVHRDSIRIWPETRLTACVESNRAFAVTLRGVHDTQVVEVDQIVLATGYKVDAGRVPLLARGNLLPRLVTDNGVPVLDEHLQSSIPGLYMTSLTAVRDFGPFLGFTVAVRASAKLVGDAIRRRQVASSA